MKADFVVQASQDQSEVSNLRQVTRSINEQCPVYGSDCSIVGTGTPAQAAASGPLIGRRSSNWWESVLTYQRGAKGRGCSATSTQTSEFSAGLFAAAGMLGLACLRTRRARRNRGR
jgi:MYXO-CTERM domain-containing protein